MQNREQDIAHIQRLSRNTQIGILSIAAILEAVVIIGSYIEYCKNNSSNLISNSNTSLHTCNTDSNIKAPIVLGTMLIAGFTVIASCCNGLAKHLFINNINDQYHNRAPQP